MNVVRYLKFSVVIQAAGGMHLVDPLFQRVLVNKCRSKSIPVIFDEVFTGFWRLGTEVGVSQFLFILDSITVIITTISFHKNIL